MIKRYIFVHWDYSDGTELSYIEGLNSKTSFTTNVLDFFSFDTEATDVIITRANDNKEIRRSNIQNYSPDKEIKKEHNLVKLLKAGTLIFK
jgi:hypothetical protein